VRGRASERGERNLKVLGIIKWVWSERQSEREGGGGGGGGREREREIHRPKDFSQLPFNSVLILGLTISSSTFASFHKFFPFASLTILNMLGPVKDKKTTF
jgi:hypothetical protein